jgi:hypothetical protein
MVRPTTSKSPKYPKVPLKMKLIWRLVTLVQARRRSWEATERQQVHTKPSEPKEPRIFLLFIIF